ncbi:MAG: CDP-alcohol phosphatidyltransferase family protein [Bacteroidetes bacterium]|nr:CDP-alcohol phosphatidyltransferase family protein [Bacteroidota bacterium]
MGNIKTDYESTLKSRDTEETLDIWFYRPIGYRWALLCKRLGIKPNPVTITSIILGMASGYFFYFSDIRMNIVGMILLIIANSFDSADGQLARMTNQQSRLGRVLDGLAGNLWFISIYFFISLRLMNEGYSVAIFILAAITGFFHSFQAAMADYYRNAHLFFIKGKDGSEFDNSIKVRNDYNQYSWTKNFWNKLWLRIYLNYTSQQEILSKNLQKLMKLIHKKNDGIVPEWLAVEFRQLNKPLMKYTNMLTFNTRAIALFIAMFLNHVILYWIFELTILNIMLIYMVVRQENISKKMHYKAIFE